MANNHGRVPAIQGLRAIAILLVVLYHLNVPIGAGLIGVDVFFVISGFVITRMILQRTHGSSRLSLKDFWAGRVRRLLPALAAMCVLVALGAILFTSPIGTQGQTALTAIAANVWVSNGYLAVTGAGYFASNAGDNALMHTWSLAVEEQFYLFFPLMVVAVLWWSRRRGGSTTSRIRLWMSVVGVISFLLCLFLTYVRLPLPVGQLLAFYSPVTRAWEFAAGAVLATLFHKAWQPGRWSRLSVPVGIVVLIVGLVVINGGNNYPGWFPVLPVVAGVLLLIGSMTDAPGVQLLNNRGAVYIGDVSYSWYLFHWPVIVFATTAWSGDLPWWMTVIAAIVGFALACASYHWLEQPIRTRQWAPNLRTPLLACVAIVPTLLASVVLYAGADKGWGNADVQSMQTQLDHSQWNYQKVCQSPYKINDRDNSECRFPGDPTKKPIILVGDSNAGVYADMMVQVAADLHRTLTIATVPSCALVALGTIDKNGSSFLDCDDYYKSSMTWLAQQPKSTVVVADGMAAVDYPDLKLQMPNGDKVSNRHERQEVYEAALETTYRDLQAMGHTVLQVQRVPHFLTWRPQLCSMLEILRDGIESCGTSQPRAEADKDQSGALAAQQKATSALGVREILVRDALCPNGVCGTNDHNTWRYEDGGHLSYAEAMSLKPIFTAALR